MTIAFFAQILLNSIRNFRTFGTLRSRLGEALLGQAEPGAARSQCALFCAIANSRKTKFLTAAIHQNGIY